MGCFVIAMRFAIHSLSLTSGVRNTFGGEATTLDGEGAGRYDPTRIRCGMILTLDEIDGKDGW